MSSKVIPVVAGVRAARKTDKSAKTRKTLIQVALRLISEKGVDGTTVVDITQLLGISNGSFYYHFLNMDHLLEEVGHNVVQALADKIGSVQREDPAAQVVRGPLVLFHYLNEHPQMKSIALRILLDLEGRHADLKRGLKQVVLRGQSLGRFASEDADQAAQFCTSLLIAMIRSQSGRGQKTAILTAVHTLTMLGLPIGEAREIVQNELALLKDELANLEQEVLSNPR